MDIFAVLAFIGGLAMFLFGMNTMGDGLVKVSGGKMDSILSRLTSNRFKAVLLGTAVTAVIQSSSVTTVMVVGFVNSGIMKLGQAVGVIMGANIGTTLTSWLLSLTGIDGGAVWIQLLKPSSFAPVLAAIGVVMMMTGKGHERRRDISTILLGFAILMTGMNTMSDAVSPLADNESFTSLLTMFSNPLLGVLVGALLTAVIQSSSASVGILQAFCLTGAVPYGSAIAIIMGQNIGTCVTALISSIGGGRNAKRTAMMHLYFNLIGTIVFMIIFYGINAFVHFEFLTASASVVGVAIFHSVFNIACCIAWFPFSNLLVKLACITLPDKSEKESKELTMSDSVDVLDPRFLEKPAYAVKISLETAVKMAKKTRDILRCSMRLMTENSPDDVALLTTLGENVDTYQNALGNYLMQLSGRSLGKDDSRQVSIMLQSVLDFRRIADHAEHMGRAMNEIRAMDGEISEEELCEIASFCGEIGNILERTILVFAYADSELALELVAEKDDYDARFIDLKEAHIDVLRQGKCAMEIGVILEDVISDIEAIYAHCFNVNNCMLQEIQVG